jgi:hypothetical protein
LNSHVWFGHDGLLDQSVGCLQPTPGYLLVTATLSPTLTGPQRSAIGVPQVERISRGIVRDLADLKNAFFAFKA